MKPLFLHDCPNCRFLGTNHTLNAITGEQEVADLYVCEARPNPNAPDPDPIEVQRSRASLIARHSSEVDDYTSVWVKHIDLFQSADLHVARALYLCHLNVWSYGVARGNHTFTDRSDIVAIEWPVNEA